MEWFYLLIPIATAAVGYLLRVLIKVIFSKPIETLEGKVDKMDERLTGQMNGFQEDITDLRKENHKSHMEVLGHLLNLKDR